MEQQLLKGMTEKMATQTMSGRKINFLLFTYTLADFTVNPKADEILFP